MKIKLTISLLSMSFLTYAQSLDFGFNAGTGATYIVITQTKELM